MNRTLQTQSSSPVATAPPRPHRVAIVASTWHRDIVDRGTAAIRAELACHAHPPERIDLFEVPGAFEIPLHARRLAECGHYDAVIACGLVVNGGIYRHEFVASAVIDGLMRVQLDAGVPVLSAVLTPHEFHDHDDHRRFFSAHFERKGGEVARACLATLASLNALALAAAFPLDERSARSVKT